MRVMTAGGAALAVALAARATVAAPAPKTLKCHVTTVTDAQGMHVNVEANVWVKGQKARVEAKDPVRGQVLVLMDGRQVRTLLPQQKRGTLVTFSGEKGHRNPWEIAFANVEQLTRGAKKLGQAKLEGYTCDIYEATQNSPQATATIKSWITRGTQPRLPLKVEKSLRVHQPNMTVSQSETVRLTDVHFGVPIPDSLFAVPPGYKIEPARAAGAPGLPRGPRAGMAP